MLYKPSLDLLRLDITVEHSSTVTGDRNIEDSIGDMRESESKEL